MSKKISNTFRTPLTFEEWKVASWVSNPVTDSRIQMDRAIAILTFFHSPIELTNHIVKSPNHLGRYMVDLLTEVQIQK